MSSYEKKPIHDEDTPFYHLDSEGGLTWTDEGLRTYRRRFARFGLRIESMTTFADYQTAMRLSARVFVEDTLEQLAERCAGKPYHERLVTVLTGDATAIERARRRYQMRQKLHVLSSTAE